MDMKHLSELGEKDERINEDEFMNFFAQCLGG